LEVILSGQWFRQFAKRYSHFWLGEFGGEIDVRPLPTLDAESQDIVASFHRVLKSMTQQRRAHPLDNNISAAQDDAEYQSAVRELSSEAGRQLKYVWLVQAKDYESVCTADMNRFLHEYPLWMSMGRTNLYLDGTIELQVNYSDFSFAAFITPTPGTCLEECRIYLSGGMLFALDDLACRIFCNQGMLAWDVTKGSSNWNGCDCYFGSSNEPSVRPMVRYWNYEVAEADLLSSRVAGPWRGNLLPAYFSGMPVGAEDRINAASFAATIGLSWILAHEEAHYRNGHVHMLSELPTAPDEEVQTLFAEGSSSDLPISDARLKRQLEWNADCSATNAVFDIFFVESHLQHLPANCPRNAEWLLRLVISGILLPVMLIDLGAQFTASKDDHPSGLCRLICIIATACRRLKEMVRPGPRYRPDIANLANLPEEATLLAFTYRVVMGAMTEASVIGEILENENSEGRNPFRYEHPMGEGDNIAYLVYETLKTMFKPETFAFFAERIPAPPPPSDDLRLSTAVFDEVGTYIKSDPKSDPLIARLNAYSETLAATHREKIVKLLGKQKTDILFGD
jgi:hypothetical protein